MSFTKQNFLLKKIFLFAVLAIAVVTNSGCGVIARGLSDAWEAITGSLRTTRVVGSLSKEETGWAKAAWKYFENNYNENTGLVNASQDYPVVNLWNIGDYIVALSSAYELEIIDKATFDYRLTKVIAFLNSMQLLNNKLPNIYYHAKNGEPVNSNGGQELVGWSAQDMGRLMIALKIVRERYPEYGEYIEKALLRWNLCDVIDSAGTIRSGYMDGNTPRPNQELKLGVKQYVARGFQAWGFNVPAAVSPDPYESLLINGVRVYYDGRDERRDNSINAVISLPYLLDGMEFQWQSVGNCQRSDFIEAHPMLTDMAEAVYKVQEKRYEEEKTFTARTSHAVSSEPYFVYDAIFANGYPWNTISGNNAYYPRLALVSTKAAFGMWVLWNTPYTNNLIKVVNTLFDPSRGWFEGRREQTGEVEYSLTLSTNATVLEALLFKKGGAIYHTPIQPETFYELYTKDTYLGKSRCPGLKKNTCK